jgi:transposase
MLIIGCDYHPSVQQIAWADTETGECGEKRLMHSDGEAERFYRELKQKGVQVRVGIEATGHSRWFECLLAELGFELWVGDAAEIRAARVRKQRNDRFDAKHILKLLLEDRFPKIWTASSENRDVRQLLLHRHRLVGMRTRVMNQLQAIAMNEGLRQKKGLWSKKGRARLESLSLAPWSSRRRQELLELVDRLNPNDRRIEQSDRARSGATSRSTTTDDSSWGRAHHSAGLCPNHRHSGTVSLRPADRQLSGTDSLRGVQRRSLAAGTHYQARQCADAVLAGGGGTDSGAL